MVAHTIAYDEHRAETEIRLEALGAFIKEFRAMMISNRATERAKIDEEFKSDPLKNECVSDEEISAEQKWEQVLYETAFHYYFPHVIKHYGELPRTFNYSCLIQIYTLLEERGKLLCEDLKEKDLTIIFSVNDLKGNTEIECIKVFLEKQCKVTLTAWSQIDVLRRIRNEIVHSNGLVRKQSNIEEYKKISGVEIQSHNRLRIKDEYVDSIFSAVKETFYSIFKQLKYPESMKIARWPEYVSISINPTTRDIEIKED